MSESSHLSAVVFTDVGVRFPVYPFPPARIPADRTVPWADIEACALGWPPELWTHQGDVLFVSAVERDALVAAMRERGVPVANRVDIWSFLLDPFLDTEIGPEEEERTLALLERTGVSRAEADMWRARVGSIMYAYNFGTMLWEWVHLGLYDLLSAHWMFRDRLGMDDRQLHDFYWEAIALARRATLTPAALWR